MEKYHRKYCVHNFRAISVQGQQTALVLLNLKYSVKFEETSLGRKTLNVQFN